MVKKIKILSVFRIIVQLAFLCLLPGVFILAFDGLKELYLAAIHGSFSLSLFPQFIAAIAVIPFTILLGRFFCGWMCAFGAFSDFLYTLPHLFFRHKLRIPEKADRFLKGIKYLVLVVSVILIWTLGFNGLNALSPWDAFAQLPSVSSAVRLYAAGSLVLLAVTVCSVFIERFFCRYLCPLGAAFAILSKLRLVSIGKPNEKCGKCRICTQSCPMAIHLYKSDKSRSGECIGCMKCIQACPRKNVSFSVANESINPALAGSMAVGAMIGLYSFQNLISPAIMAAGSSVVQTDSAANSGGTASNSSSSSAASSAGSTYSASPSAPSSGSAASSPAAGSSSSVQSGKYIDGTYTGTGVGYRPGLNVTVTVSGGRITKIEIGSNNETPSFSMMPFRIIPQEIITSQSTQVDAVSGATRSSDGIMIAVSNALKNAVAP